MEVTPDYWRNLESGAVCWQSAGSCAKAFATAGGTARYASGIRCVAAGVQAALRRRASQEDRRGRERGAESESASLLERKYRPVVSVFGKSAAAVRRKPWSVPVFLRFPPVFPFSPQSCRACRSQGRAAPFQQRPLRRWRKPARRQTQFAFESCCPDNRLHRRRPQAAHTGRVTMAAIR